MREFQVLIDSFRSTVDDEEWTDGLIWVFPTQPKRGDRVQAFAGTQFGPQLGDAERYLLQARQKDFSEKEIWEYLATHGGNGYTMLRLGPFDEEGESADELGTERIAELA